jgi:hypothetical protein
MVASKRIMPIGKYIICLSRTPRETRYSLQWTLLINWHQLSRILRDWAKLGKPSVH